MKIPKEFYMGDEKSPIVRNVKELRDQLSRLPDDLPIECGFGRAEMVVYNHGSPDMHLEFREVDDD